MEKYRRKPENGMKEIRQLVCRMAKDPETKGMVKYDPDMTDEEVRQIEAVHEANRQLIADYEAKHKK